MCVCVHHTITLSLYHSTPHRNGKNAEGWYTLTAQGSLHPVLSCCLSTARGTYFCLLCCQPVPVRRLSCARTWFWLQRTSIILKVGATILGVFSTLCVRPFFFQGGIKRIIIIIIMCAARLHRPLLLAADLSALSTDCAPACQSKPNGCPL